MKRYPFVDKTAVVTGASTGIGRATARMLQARGWRVFPTVRNPTDFELLQGEGFEPIELDLADADSVAQAAKTILELAQGRLGAYTPVAAMTRRGAYAVGYREGFSQGYFEGSFLAEGRKPNPLFFGVPNP